MSEQPEDPVPTLPSQGHVTPADSRTQWPTDPAAPDQLTKESKYQDTTAVTSVPMVGPDGVLRIGRFRILGTLGSGGFGMVYRARDEELERDVAIKTPRTNQLASSEAADSYLAEARTLASLDHPGIVPVYEIGFARDRSRYLVSKFVAGRDLAQRLKDGPLPSNEAAHLIARVAIALAHAHERGLIHRDIKPGNILLDTEGHPLLADFGLALREQDLADTHITAGTPSYMSPEQARGEGHRVDARSDLFSLGVVFYETLTGQRPFADNDVSLLLQRITTQEPEAPRHLDGGIPREVERICLKALAKRAKDRYQSAMELAGDLHHWLQQAGHATTVRLPLTPARPPTSAPESDLANVHVVPRCLRAFEASDAGFFLALLPGPRDRDNLPGSVRFWKTHIEAFDTEEAFAVGLLYGPSGCGKSSLVRAALLPRLARSVQAIYLEAATEGTEARLARSLRQQFPSLPRDANLHELLAHLRRGEGLPKGRKVLLVLDQFEQWLFAKRMEENTELVQALRHCDGVHVQALVLIRDDFWMAASRFFRELEIPVVEGRNAAAVDLFDLAHARKVLTLFGRAFGALQEQALVPEQVSFVEQAVSGLAQDGKVISVRLSLFAEMIKHKPWTPATLKTVGGAEGVGVAFLEETFSARSAPVAHRVHERAAQAVLKALLPQQGTDIKGHMRSVEELQAASGYGADRFQEVLQILDQELRLVTPAEGEHDSAHLYQLTHDYLVPSLRAWLTRKQRETRRGRAELLLNDRAALWQIKPERRLLPSSGEWLSLILLTQARDWTDSQRRMMGQATRHHLSRALVAATFLAVLFWGAYELVSGQKAAGLVRALASAETLDVPRLVRELAAYRPWATPALQKMAQESAPGSKERLHAALALAPVDETQADYLLDHLLTADPIQFPVIRNALLPFREHATLKLESILQDDKILSAQRFRAACGLAVLAPDSTALEAAKQTVAEYLVKENPLLVGRWVEILRPIAFIMTPPLARIFKEDKRPEADRSVAANVLADYAATQPETLINLALEATPAQFALLLPRILNIAETAVPLLHRELEQQARFDWHDAPIDPAWSKVDAALAHQIESAQGLVDERFAFCQTLPLEAFDKLTAELAQRGYRPVRVRPYRASHDLVAAVWTRDSRPHRVVSQLTRSALDQQDVILQHEGFRIEDVAGYVDSQGDDRFVAIWTKRATGDESGFYAGAIADEQKSAQEAFQKRKWTPATVQVYSGPNGLPRYCGVWRKPTSADLEWKIGINKSEKDFEADAPLGQAQLDVTLVCDVNKNRVYGVVYQLSATHETAELHGLDPAEHLAGCRELVKQGFRPAAWSAADFTNAVNDLRQPAGTDSQGTLVAASVWQRPLVPVAAKNVLAERQAAAAVVLLHLDQAERVWPLLKHTPEPRLRTALIHHLGPLGITPDLLLARLRADPEISERRALLLSLGEISPEGRVPAWGESLLESLKLTYRTDPDAGLHGAVEWLLRRWGLNEELKKIDHALAGHERKLVLQRAPTWYTNSQGQTMIVIPGAAEFSMGSPGFEPDRLPNESLHRRRILQSYALANKEVTLTQFERFKQAYPVTKHYYTPRYAPDPNCPQISVTWYEAAMYCRWLSEVEKVPEDQMCYPSIKEILACSESHKPLDLPANYLQRMGYRLPTEAEWEYACRAGSRTSRYFGDAQLYLGNYAWFLTNSSERSWPVGTKKPNDYGCFDMLGNVAEWCQDRFQNYAGMSGTSHDAAKVGERDERIVRSGTFNMPATILRSSGRVGFPPASRFFSIGFRPARTQPDGK